MKKSVKAMISAFVALASATTVAAESVTLYSLDNRTIEVDESEVTIYTAEGMGWYTLKPVEMYSADGRTIIVAADQVEAHENVGWFKSKEEAESQNKPQVQAPVVEKKVSITLPGGPTIIVPAEQLDAYKALGWVQNEGEVVQKVTVYNSKGEEKEINAEELEEYIAAGWMQTKPQINYVTVYNAGGETKSVPDFDVEGMKAQGWYTAYDEAVYAYAAFGDASVEGAVKALENKKYEAAFNMVQDAILKLENTSSEYVTMLYYLRTQVTDTWRAAANSPLGFINFWFNKNNNKNTIVFEYRNVSNSRIQAFKIKFDICDSEGNIVETNDGAYVVDGIEMAPCEKKRITWGIQSGGAGYSIKNLKVHEVKFSDGTIWRNA